MRRPRFKVCAGDLGESRGEARRGEAEGRRRDGTGRNARRAARGEMQLHLPEERIVDLAALVLHDDPERVTYRLNNVPRSRRHGAERENDIPIEMTLRLFLVASSAFVRLRPLRPTDALP